MAAEYKTKWVSYVHHFYVILSSQKTVSIYLQLKVRVIKTFKDFL